MPSNNLTTNECQSSDQLDSLGQQIQSATSTSPELYGNINKYVGIFLKQNDTGSSASTDYTGELEQLLGSQFSNIIQQAESNYYNQKAQHAPDDSTSGKNTQADPVMMYNGQFVHTVQDIKINGAGIDFVFIRTYKNQAFHQGPLGYNWDHNYNLWLREEGTSIVRSSGELREDRYIRHKTNKYYIPPDGYHDVIEPYGNSFILTMYNGTTYSYERINTTLLHRIKTIRDRNTNQFSFSYYPNTGLLESIEVNTQNRINSNQKRIINFQYDDMNRIIKIIAYPVTYNKNGNDTKVQRTWQYKYDDFGDLVSVTTPSTDAYPDGITTLYEYSSSQMSGDLMHNLLSITDGMGFLYLENEYGIQKGLLSYNRIVRQRQGNGEYIIDYSDVIPDLSWNYTPQEMPAHYVTIYQRNGHAVYNTYNQFGNLIVQEEQVLGTCMITDCVTRYRYNEDGALVATLTPEGSIIQYYLGREDYYRRIYDGIVPPPYQEDDNLTKQERWKFGNVLAVVKRGKYYDFLQMDTSMGVYGDFFPDVLVSEGNDIVKRFTYENAFQQIASISDPRVTTNANPRDREVTHPTSSNYKNYNKHLTIYRYDNSAAVKLTQITYPDINYPSLLPNGTTGLNTIVQQYLVYDANGRIKKIQDPEGNYIFYQYFVPASPSPIEGYLQKEIHAYGSLDLTTEYKVNEAGIVTTRINPRGFTTTFFVNELDQTIKTISAGPGYVTNNFFDRNNKLQRSERDNIDCNGNVSSDGPETITYEYDSQNNLLQQSIGGTDFSKHHVTKHFYNSSDKKIRTVLPRGNEIYYKYEERLLLDEVIRAPCSPDSSIVKTVYDGDKRITQIIDARGNSTTFQYDPFDRKILTIDAQCNYQQKEYDKLDNITIERFFENRSGNKFYLLARKTYSYDEQGNKIIESVYIFNDPIFTANPLGNPDVEFLTVQTSGLVQEAKTQYFYDKNKRLIRILNANGQETTYQYDSANRKIMDKDALGNYIVTSYDENSNVIRVDRHEVILNSAGGVIREEVFSTLNQYDPLDRKTSTTDNLGNNVVSNYDSRNNLCKITDPLQNVKQYQYDIYNRKSTEIDQVTETGLGAGTRLPDIVTTFGYDENNNQISEIDAKNNATLFDYDALDRLSRTTYQDSSFKELKYDPNSNIIQSTDNNGLQVLLTYDTLNRKISTSLNKTNANPSYPTDADDSEEYEYDGLGRTLVQSNNFCQIKTKFDSLNRPYNEVVKFTTFPTPPGSIVLKRTFDLLSNRTVLTYPSGRQIQYDYDGLNRIVQITNKKKGAGYPGSSVFTGQSYLIAQFVYGGLRLSNATYGNTTSYNLFYDGSGRTISIQHLDTTGTLPPMLEIQQLYDAAGNKRFEVNVAPTSTTGEIYKYNSVYWLTKFANKNIPTINTATYLPPNAPLNPAALNGQQTIDNTIGPLAQNTSNNIFQYDLLGNRVQEKIPGQATIHYKTNFLNEYLIVNGNYFKYDSNGNLIQDDSKNYFYNYRNQIIRVEKKSNNKVLINAFYDNVGRLVAIKEFGILKYLINDGLNIIEEYKGTNVISQHVFENKIDNTCQTVSNSEEFWYHFDIVRSTRLLSNSKGKIPTGGKYDYDPFGNASFTTQYTPYLFAGKRWFSSIESYYSRARQYIPSIGRFAQRDPKGMIDGSNLYLYVTNNPLTFTDPQGTDTKEVKFDTGDVIVAGKVNMNDYGLLDEWQRKEALTPEQKDWINKQNKKIAHQLIRKGQADAAKFAAATYAIGITSVGTGSAADWAVGTLLGTETLSVGLESGELSLINEETKVTTSLLTREGYKEGLDYALKFGAQKAAAGFTGKYFEGVVSQSLGKRQSLYDLLKDSSIDAFKEIGYGLIPEVNGLPPDMIKTIKEIDSPKQEEK